MASASTVDAALLLTGVANVGACGDTGITLARRTAGQAARAGTTTQRDGAPRRGRSTTRIAAAH
jgi:hypothetical protein